MPDRAQRDLDGQSLGYLSHRNAGGIPNLQQPYVQTVPGMLLNPAMVAFPVETFGAVGVSCIR